MSVKLHQNWNEAHRQVGRLVEHLEQVEAELEKARKRIWELENREREQREQREQAEENPNAKA